MFPTTMSNESYLIDTVNVRSTSRSEIKQLYGQNKTLCISPFTFYEIFSHVNDDASLNEFKKKHLEKFYHLEILQDPEYVMRLVQNTVDGRYGSDEERIKAACNAISDSKSLEELNKCRIKESNGTIRTLQEVHNRVPIILTEREKEFTEKCSQALIFLKKSGATADDLTNILSLCKNETAKNNLSTAKELEFIDRYFISYAAIYFWIKEHIDNGHSHIAYSKKGKEGNTYEDTSLLKHISITKKSTFVTQDKSLVRIYSKSLNLVNDNKERFTDSGLDMAVHKIINKLPSE